jgi:hypothetical protein
MAEFAEAFSVDLTSFDPCCYFAIEGFLYGFFTLFHSKKIRNCINQKKKKNNTWDVGASSKKRGLE